MFRYSRENCTLFSQQNFQKRISHQHSNETIYHKSPTTSHCLLKTTSSGGFRQHWQMRIEHFNICIKRRIERLRRLHLIIVYSFELCADMIELVVIRFYVRYALHLLRKKQNWILPFDLLTLKFAYFVNPVMLLITWKNNFVSPCNHSIRGNKLDTG